MAFALQVEPEPLIVTYVAASALPAPVRAEPITNASAAKEEAARVTIREVHMARAIPFWRESARGRASTPVRAGASAACRDDRHRGRGSVRWRTGPGREASGSPRSRNRR